MHVVYSYLCPLLFSHLPVMWCQGFVKSLSFGDSESVCDDDCGFGSIFWFISYFPPADKSVMYLWSFWCSVVRRRASTHRLKTSLVKQSCLCLPGQSIVIDDNPENMKEEGKTTRGMSSETIKITCEAREWACMKIAHRWLTDNWLKLDWRKRFIIQTSKRWLTCTWRGCQVHGTSGNTLHRHDRVEQTWLCHILPYTQVERRISCGDWPSWLLTIEEGISQTQWWRIGQLEWDSSFLVKLFYNSSITRCEFEVVKELWNLFVVTVRWCSFCFMRVSLYTLPTGCIACFSHVIARIFVAVRGLLVDTRPPTLNSKAIPIGDFFRLMSLCMFRFVLFHSLLNDSGQLNLSYSLKKDQIPQSSEAVHKVTPCNTRRGIHCRREWCTTLRKRMMILVQSTKWRSHNYGPPVDFPFDRDVRPLSIFLFSVGLD